MAYALIAVGMVLLFAGGEGFVLGGVGLARFFQMPLLVMGLLVVSLGDSTPELLVTFNALGRGEPELAGGMLVGSNIANIFLVLGAAALIGPLTTSPKVVFKDGGVMIAAFILLVILSWDSQIGRLEGLLLFAGFLAFLITSFFIDWGRPGLHSEFEARAQSRMRKLEPVASFLLVIFGMIFLFYGARYVVFAGLKIAQDNNLSQAI